jgi:hypothetical protein
MEMGPQAPQPGTARHFPVPLQGQDQKIPPAEPCSRKLELPNSNSFPTEKEEEVRRLLSGGAVFARIFTEPPRLEGEAADGTRLGIRLAIRIRLPILGRFFESTPRADSCAFDLYDLDPPRYTLVYNILKQMFLPQRKKL